jgi:hypothetical protein
VAFAEGGENSFHNFDAWTTHEGVYDPDKYYRLVADCGPACEQVYSDDLPDGKAYKVTWGWPAEHRSYHLDTIEDHPDDWNSGLEFDEIAVTGEYPCTHFVNGMCA